MAAIWAAAIGAVASVATSGQKKGGAGDYSPPDSFADAKSTQAMFDNSGWNVTFGANSPITSTSQKTASQDNTPLQSAYGLPAVAGSTVGGIPLNYIIAGLVVLVIVKKMKKG